MQAFAAGQVARRGILIVRPWEKTMPYVNIKVTREGTLPGETATTPEQKKALIKGVSDLLFDVMGKAPHTTYVIIEEVDLENWGVGGVTTPEYRQQITAAADKSK